MIMPHSLAADSPPGFSSEQKEFLEGFLAAVASRAKLDGDTTGAATEAKPVPAIFGTPLEDATKPERWKYEQNPLDIWEKLLAHADADKFPDEADTFRFKFHGLFYVAPAQDSFMLRLRLPAGEITSAQLRGLAEIADWGGGYAHVTTRANLQVRELRPHDIVRVLIRLQELGLTSRGAGADNIRNITTSPDSGFAREELIDVAPFAKALHHYILNHRDLYGLPRKFNVAFDNGGALSAACDTNDLAFQAVRVTERSLGAAGGTVSPDVGPGIYFRVQLGGISGHGDFARDTGLLLKPIECLSVAAAMLRVFNENGDRTNRKKARLKYLLEKWGVEKFIEETQKKIPFPLRRVTLAACEPRPPFRKHGWLGVIPQAQPGLNCLGIGVPVGRLTTEQMRGLAGLAERQGRGELRLTVWQNVLLPHVPDAAMAEVRREVRALGLFTEAGCATGGIVACTGNKGCKYAATDTKGHAVALAARLAVAETGLDQPVNIHFTGCPHSCAQHYCGDIGLLGAKLADGSEGYHLVLGGGMGDEQGIAREVLRDVPAGEVPARVERILRAYLAGRSGTESFITWSRRQTVAELTAQFTS
jgi:ferredoxin-nitrite reductase